MASGGIVLFHDLGRGREQDAMFVFTRSSGRVLGGEKGAKGVFKHQVIEEKRDFMWT